MPTPSQTPHHFRFGPFSITSQLDIPELRNTTGPAHIPVTLTLGDTPSHLPGAPHYGPLCQVTPTRYLLEIPNVARYFVCDGTSIRITLHPGAPAADVSSYLLGSVFGALCHQNALLPLHASAIQTPAGITAFLGESGAGKSTLAAALARRGHAVVSDDICLLEQTSGGMNVIPVAGWLKLWRNSLDHLGETPNEQHRVFARDDKYRVFLDASDSARQATLHRLIFLARAPGSSTPPRLDPLSTPETIAHMMRLTYLGYITELTGSHARVFAQCALALSSAKAFRLTVPWDLSRLDSTLDLLESSPDLLPTLP